MRVLAEAERVLLAQRGALFPWAPVCFATGIGGYFTLRSEPGAAHYTAAVCLAIFAALLALRRPGAFAPLFWALCLTACGFSAAGWRAHSVQNPVLEWR